MTLEEEGDAGVSGRGGRSERAEYAYEDDDGRSSKGVLRSEVRSEDAITKGATAINPVIAAV